MSMKREQTHLNHRDTVNYGSYYTPESIVRLVYEFLDAHIHGGYVILDTSCGYGGFLTRPNALGADIDGAALRTAASKNARLFQHNSLLNVGRSQYGLKNEKLVIIGNPPYNDRTSIIRNDLKEGVCEVDADLRHRDLGVSFLLSYDKLAADYICVLHPLSYLIKKANFESLGSFKRSYRLKDGLIISSGEFSATSKTTHFPIIVAFYERDAVGMTYDYIRAYPFKTKEGRRFKLNGFDTLARYATKYSNQNYWPLEKTAAFFWTMRDINALKRTKSFIEKEVGNSIRVPPDKLPYYCYADVFKDNIRHIPYYFGNCDVMLDHYRFEELKEAFVVASLKKYPFLSHLLPPGAEIYVRHETAIDIYFKNLLGEHYVD